MIFIIKYLQGKNFLPCFKCCYFTLFYIDFQVCTRLNLEYMDFARPFNPEHLYFTLFYTDFQCITGLKYVFTLFNVHYQTLTGLVFEYMELNTCKVFCVRHAEGKPSGLVRSPSPTLSLLSRGWAGGAQHR
ncbi:MAG: hypothetical protein NZ455_14990 [Bacteroidia bacterium]|nr:hypothetical protein [Bacteroidia bacterium]